jgi:uncharacterized LabA/DUF88 family protein
MNMNNLNEERLKIAVFIDFDNIAIGVKQSLNRNFDVGTVLEAIKEKGEVITKIAYGDWKRAEDFSRAMTQHAVQMVQRNLTPGGDKNGADIALALDALETAFTRSHINAFVIVGGDSDFIALVEKLKQYDKTVFVVGGRAFTSIILQKNCHEFISYENLVGIQSGSRRSTGKSFSGTSSLEQALPLIRRALKILSDREVSPQLGLLKSTLLQLDSTFSERDYGVSSFRDFIQKLSDAGHVNLKQVDRSLMVELKDTDVADVADVADIVVKSDTPEPPRPSTEATVEPAPAEEPPAPSLPASDASRVLEELLRDAKIKPHWPMYLRTFKQMIRSLQPTFDERHYGLSSAYDLARQTHKDGLFRVERNRQGILRIFPGEHFPRTDQESDQESAAQESAVQGPTDQATTDESSPVESPGSANAEPQPASSGTTPQTMRSETKTVLQRQATIADLTPGPSNETAPDMKETSAEESAFDAPLSSPAEPATQSSQPPPAGEETLGDTRKNARENAREHARGNISNRLSGVTSEASIAAEEPVEEKSSKPGTRRKTVPSKKTKTAKKATEPSKSAAGKTAGKTTRKTAGKSPKAERSETKS